MGTLLFDFVVQLRDGNHPYPFDHEGPLFHRWLPNGEKDAIVLDTGDPQSELKVSFEHRGYVDDGYVRFDWKRDEVDPSIIPRQAVLEGGHLAGWLKIELPDEELEALRKVSTGDPAYEALGRRLIKLIRPPVNKLINLLRTNYGQYWLREIEEWDSRSRSLGSFCAGLGIRWSLDGGKTWGNLSPRNGLRSLTA